jgi:L-threonylcarbamoyladenylate synthase
MNVPAEAVTALRAGEVVGVPTDTVYGLAVDPLDPRAVARLFQLKGRPADRPIALLVASREQAGRLVRFGTEAGRLADRHWPGALTLVLPVLGRLPEWVGDRVAGTVGVRMPAGEPVHSLLEAAGPLAVTSANRSGSDPALDDVEAEAMFGDAVRVYLPGTCPGGVASTVVDATGSRLRVVREGPIRVD